MSLGSVWIALSFAPLSLHHRARQEASHIGVRRFAVHPHLRVAVRIRHVLHLGAPWHIEPLPVPLHAPAGRRGFPLLRAEVVVVKT